MLINGKRALAYTARCGKVINIEGADNIQLMMVGGWSLIIKRDEFKEGDLCVYFEIDSKLPKADWSEFLANKKYKIKTMKLNKFGVVSQGLAMPLPLLGVEATEENVDLTDTLKVTYATKEDNFRKADDYDRMRQRHNELFKKSKILKWLFKRDWGKRLLLVFLGKSKNSWPAWVKKTDEERVQNMTWVFQTDKKWIVTEKIDGTSATYTIKRKAAGNQFYVCSRNVCFDTKKNKDKCYYDTNIYLDNEKKYNIKEVLADILSKNSKLDYVTLQGEIYGEGVQKKDYKLKGQDFAAFNLIMGYKNGAIANLDAIKMKNLLDIYNIPTVPILATDFRLPLTCQDLLDFAEGQSVIDSGTIREGVVLRTIEGDISMKAVSISYLLEKKD